MIQAKAQVDRQGFHRGTHKRENGTLRKGGARGDQRVTHSFGGGGASVPAGESALGRATGGGESDTLDTFEIGRASCRERV